MSRENQATMTESKAPPGWSYNPSDWSQRLPIVWPLIASIAVIVGLEVTRPLRWLNLALGGGRGDGCLPWHEQAAFQSELRQLFGKLNSRATRVPKRKS